MDVQYLTPQELSDRWRGQVAVSTLAVWRSTGKGPSFTKTGRGILYSIESVEEYERANTVKPEPCAIPVYVASCIDTDDVVGIRFDFDEAKAFALEYSMCSGVPPYEMSVQKWTTAGAEWEWSSVDDSVTPFTKEARND